MAAVSGYLRIKMLNFTSSPTGLTVSGTTFAIKEDLKNLGGKWEPDTKSWLLSPALDTLATRTSLQLKLKEQKAERLYAASPEGKRKQVLAALEHKKGGHYHWICCEECEVIDWQRQHTACRVHSHDGNTFRVRGNIYTGN